MHVGRDVHQKVRVLVVYYKRLRANHCRRGRDAPADFYLPHVGLQLWVQYPDSLEIPYQCTLNAVGTFFVEPSHDVSTSRAKEFYIECVEASDGVGGDALALRLISELRGGPSSLPKLTSLILPTLSWLAAGVQTPFLPAASNHALLQELRCKVDMLAQCGGEQTRALVLSQKVAMQLARYVSQSFLTHLNSKTHQAHMWRTYATSFVVLLRLEPYGRAGES